MSDMFNFNAEPEYFLNPFNQSEDLVFTEAWGSEDIQEFGYNEPMFSLFGYPDIKLAPLSTTAGTESTSMSEGNLKKRKTSKSSSDVSSLLSFDPNLSKIQTGEI